MSAKLRYSREELMSSHVYARPNQESGRLFQGGFDADGVDVSPRSLFRRPAAEAWRDALLKRGWPLIDPFIKIGNDPGYPNVAQFKYLLQLGLDKTLWDQLSMIGMLEQRARNLYDVVAPDMQAVIVEDISETALGHLNQGLLLAHGMDETGDPDTPHLGAHDAVWFAIRDFVLGESAHPIPADTEGVRRPEGANEVSGLPPAHERMLKYLMHILMIEARAAPLFGVCTRLFNDDELFQDRRNAARRAALMVERLEFDESIHLLYLGTAISEFRSFTIKRVDGRLASGAEIIDPMWKQVVDWHCVNERDAARESARADMERDVLAACGEAGPELMTTLDALEAPAPI